MGTTGPIFILGMRLAIRAGTTHAILNRLSPSATEMIRADHTRVMAVFHRYHIDASPAPSAPS